MGEPVTQGQFFERMAQLEEKMQDYHRRQRDHIDAQTEKLEAAFQTHETEDRAIADRVLMIETERGIEKTNAMRHGAIAGTVAAGLILGLVESFKRLLGR